MFFCVNCELILSLVTTFCGVRVGRLNIVSLMILLTFSSASSRIRLFCAFQSSHWSISRRCSSTMKTLLGLCDGIVWPRIQYNHVLRMTRLIGRSAEYPKRNALVDLNQLGHPTTTTAAHSAMFLLHRANKSEAVCELGVRGKSPTDRT